MVEKNNNEIFFEVSELIDRLFKPYSGYEIPSFCEKCRFYSKKNGLLVCDFVKEAEIGDKTITFCGSHPQKNATSGDWKRLKFLKENGFVKIK